MNVKEFSKRIGLNPHTVRYYEKMGLLRDVQRLSNGHRYFSDRDIQWIEFIQRLKETGMPLEQIRRYADLRAQGDSTMSARQRLLEAHAEALQESIARQQRHLNKLGEKIAIYQSAMDRKKNT